MNISISIVRASLHTVGGTLDVCASVDNATSVVNVYVVKQKRAVAACFRPIV